MVKYQSYYLNRTPRREYVKLLVSCQLSPCLPNRTEELCLPVEDILRLRPIQEAMLSLSACNIYEDY